MCKIKNIFGDFSDMEITINNSMTPVFTIFDVLEGIFEIFDRFENFTPSRNKVWNPPFADPWGIFNSNERQQNFSSKTPYKKIILFPTSDFCHDWQWDGKLKAVLKNDRFFGYQVTGLSGLETTDCLCYKYRPSIFDIVSNHRKIMEYSLFGVLRKVFGPSVIITYESTFNFLTFKNHKKAPARYFFFSLLL